MAVSHDKPGQMWQVVSMKEFDRQIPRVNEHASSVEQPVHRGRQRQHILNIVWTVMWPAYRSNMGAIHGEVVISQPQDNTRDLTDATVQIAEIAPIIAPSLHSIYYLKSPLCRTAWPRSRHLTPSLRRLSLFKRFFLRIKSIGLSPQKHIGSALDSLGKPRLGHTKQLGNLLCECCVDKLFDVVESIFEGVPLKEQS